MVDGAVEVEVVVDCGWVVGFGWIVVSATTCFDPVTKDPLFFAA